MQDDGTEMSTWFPYLILESELKKLDDGLAAEPDNIQLRFDRAATLNKLGRTGEARDEYLELLARMPTHFGALNNLGALLTATGFRTAARTAYAEAVKHHPANPVGHTHLAHALAKNGEFDASIRHFQTALQLDPHHPEAHQGLSQVFAELGDEDSAQPHRQQGFQHRSVMTVPYRGQHAPIAVLLLASTHGGTVPILNHLDDRMFFTSVVFVDVFEPSTPLPPHQVVFNAIGDADACQSSLEAAAMILRRTNAPVINSADAVMATGRASNARRLSGLQGVITPKYAILPRQVLDQPAAPGQLADLGFRFPFLLRSKGFHTGKHFLRVESAEALGDALRRLPGSELMAIEFLRSRSADGKIRKYRVMMIDGQIFPVHVAIASDWKVHYFTAEMMDHPAHRAEDEEFLNHMQNVLGPRAMQALHEIHGLLGLEYAGIDFGLNEDKDLLVFEANATMVVNPPEPDPRWDYRRAPVQQILDAIRRLFTSRVTAG